MKKQILLFATIVLISITAFPQWTQKTDFGGTLRESAAGFSIGSKGYIGTGGYFDGTNNNCYKDFWEYDPASNAWTQKADFGGAGRSGAVGFSIGNKGYIGTGTDGSGFLKDFWEYDPTGNTWVQKADFGGAGRNCAVGFSIGTKGYIGTGNVSGSFKNDFWEYDPTANTWIQKASIGVIGRWAAVGFSIGTKGYLGTGEDTTWTYYKDFWEYDPTGNTWIQKADFGGTTRQSAVGFSIGTKGYIGTGNNSTYHNDFWEYNPSTNTWIQKTDFGGLVRRHGVGFSIGAKAYIGTGGCFSGSMNYYKDFWEYNPAGDDIEEIAKEDGLKIYPNPSTTKLFIETPIVSYIEVINIEGQIIKSIFATEENTCIDISKFASGIYFVKMKTDNGVVVKKFVKK
jgi:hypothetical protein